jgi:hypothetical protein
MAFHSEQEEIFKDCYESSCWFPLCSFIWRHGKSRMSVCSSLTINWRFPRSCIKLNVWHRLDERLLGNILLSTHMSSSASQSRKGHELQSATYQYTFWQFISASWPQIRISQREQCRGDRRATVKTPNRIIAPKEKNLIGFITSSEHGTLITVRVSQ